MKKLLCVCLALTLALGLACSTAAAEESEQLFISFIVEVRPDGLFIVPDEKSGYMARVTAGSSPCSEDDSPCVEEDKDGKCIQYRKCLPLNDEIKIVGGEVQLSEEWKEIFQGWLLQPVGDSPVDNAAAILMPGEENLFILNASQLVSSGPDKDGGCGSCWAFVSKDGDVILTVNEGAFLYGEEQLADPDEARFAIAQLAGREDETSIAAVRDKENDTLYLLLDGPEDEYKFFFGQPEDGEQSIEHSDNGEDGGWLFSLD